MAAGRAEVRRILGAARRRLPKRRVRARWGNLRRQSPFSSKFGYDRGNPVDRHYVEGFLAGHAADIRGRCLEVLNDNYTRRFGGNAVLRADVLDVDPANTHVTVLADLGASASLPVGQYDCFILTQTLHYLPEPVIGIENAWNALRPGGVLLLTVPTTQRFFDWSPEFKDLWRMSPPGLRTLVERVTGADADIQGHGNLTTAIAFLLGLASEELRPSDLDHVDPEFPIVTTCRVAKEPA